MNKPDGFKYDIGAILKKKKGASWIGRVVGFYQTELNGEGYALESLYHKGTVQIYPEFMLEIADNNKDNENSI